MFTHKAKAEREAGAKEVDARSLLWRDPEAFKRPWGEWADEWETARQVESSTGRTDKQRRRTYLDPRWADVPIGSITRHDVKAWAVQLRATGISPSTVQRIVHLFSASLNAAIDAEVLESNPASRIRLPKGAQEQERFLTHEEYFAIRAELSTTADQLVADLLVSTGLRWSEMAGLHWSRVDLGRGSLSVVEVYDQTTGTVKPYPKGKRARTVPLTDDLVVALVEHQRGAGKGQSCGVDHTTGICRSGLVFTTPSGRPLRNSNWAPGWRRAVLDADVGHVRIHDLRHTYASWLLQRGIPIAEVGRLLGHISTVTTAKYAHLADSPSEAVRLALAAPRLPHEGGSESSL
ncbi:site-specific integrase [Nocardioides sp.]|uniref:tyrosine-type recombinase/integrase n=1 Tax=Nocardioides sp. TaxID=35761 RepID=UPI002D800E28|nr:site-specific integrase [Nocardioides sp.]